MFSRLERRDDRISLHRLFVRFCRVYRLRRHELARVLEAPYTTVCSWFDGAVPSLLWATKIVTAYPALRDFPNWPPPSAPMHWKVRCREVPSETKRKIAAECDEAWSRLQQGGIGLGATHLETLAKLQAGGKCCDGWRLAEEVRECIGAGSTPLRNVGDALEAIGVPVVEIHQPGSASVISLVRGDKASVCVAVVNRGELAEEDLRHGLGTELGFYLVNGVQAAAKRLAAIAFGDALLIPAKAVNRMVVPDNGRVSCETVRLLVIFFGAPEVAVHRVLARLEMKVKSGSVPTPASSTAPIATFLKMRQLT